MALKRKRSIDSSSLSSSTSSLAASTPEAQSPPLFPAAMDTENPSPFNFNTSWPVRKSGWESSAELGCRTRKRYRDNRPDERLVHESTLRRLFSAQREHPHAAPIPSVSQPPCQPRHLQQQHQYTLPTSTVTSVQKSTLHSFWNISAPPPSTTQSIHISPEPAIARCEDCDAALLSDRDATGSGMDMDIDMEMGGNGAAGSPFACCGCGRTVCDTCAVVADSRACLQCATAGRRAGMW